MKDFERAERACKDAIAHCAPKLCQREEQHHNCSLWARSGASHLCNHPLYDRSRYKRLFGNCTRCGLAAAQWAAADKTGGQWLPTIPPRDKHVHCGADDMVTTNGFLQASAEQDAAAMRLERCACAVRTVGPPVLPEWSASLSDSRGTPIIDYSETYKKALIYALAGFDGLCTPDGLRINVSVARIFGAGVNNFIFGARVDNSVNEHRTEAPSSLGLVVRVRVQQLEPALDTGPTWKQPNFDVPSLPSRIARVPAFLLSQPDALVAAGTCIWPASKRPLMAMVLPRGAAMQTEVLPSALRACRSRGIVSVLACQLDATWQSRLRG